MDTGGSLVRAAPETERRVFAQALMPAACDALAYAVTSAGLRRKFASAFDGPGRIVERVGSHETYNVRL